MSRNAMFNGFGASRYIFKKEEKLIEVDFSGNGSDFGMFYNDTSQYYRNDASIMFFSANSYWKAFDLISKEINTRFENNYSEKEIKKYILPYYFNFRHYVALELKAIIIALSNKSPKTTHKLSSLLDETIELIGKIEYNPTDRFEYLSEDKYLSIKEELIEICNELKNRITEYLNLECADEYFRYIFEQEKGNLVLKHPIIKLDYPHANNLFYCINELFNKICMKSSYITYVYYYM